MTRTTAVEVVVRLSGDGMDDARRVLIRHARHEQFSVRRACVQELIETGTEEDRKELRTILAEAGEERLLEIRRMDVREVAQATGGRFLVHPDAAARQCRHRQRLRNPPRPLDLTGRHPI
jgi:hypothetical protein